MDFTTKPPAGFEIGQNRQYYEERTSNFFYSDEPWAISFTAFATFDGEERGVGGLFADGRVTKLSVSFLPGDTFGTIPVGLPPEQFYYKLRVYHPDMTIHTNEYDEAICSIAEPTNALVTEIFYYKDEPMATYWTMKEDGDNDK